MRRALGHRFPPQLHKRPRRSHPPPRLRARQRNSGRHLVYGTAGCGGDSPSASGIHQPGDTALDAGQFRFRPATPSGIDIYLQPPQAGWFDEYEMYRAGDETVFSVGEFGDACGGTTGFHLLVHGTVGEAEALPPLEVTHELTLSETGAFGETFGARGRATIDLGHPEGQGTTPALADEGRILVEQLPRKRAINRFDAAVEATGGMDFEVIQGDIAEHTADAIVNAAGTSLRMGSGVAGALRRVAGDGLNQAAVGAGPVELGEAVVTDAFGLDADVVVHAAAMPHDGRATEASVATATHNALGAADERGCRSLVMPVLGTGAAGLAFDVGARIVCRAVADFEPEALEDVRVVAYDETQYLRLEEIAASVAD